MVNAFGDYARPPQLTTRPVALHALIGEVLDLYANDQRLSLTPPVRREATDGPGRCGAPAPGLHNLLKNALEAIGDQRKPQIVVGTRIVRDGRQHLGRAHGRRQRSGPAGGFRRTLVRAVHIKQGARHRSRPGRGQEDRRGTWRQRACGNAREGGGAEFTLRLPLESPWVERASVACGSGCEATRDTRRRRAPGLCFAAAVALPTGIPGSSIPDSVQPSCARRPSAASSGCSC